MIYELTGVIDTVFNEETFGANNFKKRIVWLNTEEQYVQNIEVQFVQGKTVELDGFKAGERVKISFALNGRKNENGDKVRVFNSINGISISRI